HTRPRTARGTVRTSATFPFLRTGGEYWTLEAFQHTCRRAIVHLPPLWQSDLRRPVGLSLIPPAAGPDPVDPRSRGTVTALHSLVETSAAVAETSSRKAKVERLATFLASLEPAEVPIAV